MKQSVTILFLFQSVFAFSQTSEVLNVLNVELAKEINAQKVDAENYYGEKFEIVKNFSIKDSILTMTAIKPDGTEDALMQTKMKILSIEIKKKNQYEAGFYTEKQEVDLRQIKTVVKDINIIFETESDAVKITRTEENGKKSIHTSDLFFLHLSYEKQNEYLADEIVKYFKKAGYEIKKGYWYD